MRCATFPLAAAGTASADCSVAAGSSTNSIANASASVMARVDMRARGALGGSWVAADLSILLLILPIKIYIGRPRKKARRGTRAACPNLTYAPKYTRQCSKRAHRRKHAPYVFSVLRKILRPQTA
jgi:hypothetical protein